MAEEEEPWQGWGRFRWGDGTARARQRLAEGAGGPGTRRRGVRGGRGQYRLPPPPPHQALWVPSCVLTLL